MAVPYSNYLDYLAESTAFTTLAGMGLHVMSLTGKGVEVFEVSVKSPVPSAVVVGSSGVALVGGASPDVGEGSPVVAGDVSPVASPRRYRRRGSGRAAGGVAPQQSIGVRVEWNDVLSGPGSQADGSACTRARPRPHPWRSSGDPTSPAVKAEQSRRFTGETSGVPTPRRVRDLPAPGSSRTGYTVEDRWFSARGQAAGALESPAMPPGLEKARRREQAWRPGAQSSIALRYSSSRLSARTNPLRSIPASFEAALIHPRWVPTRCIKALMYSR